MNMSELFLFNCGRSQGNFTRDDDAKFLQEQNALCALYIELEISFAFTVRSVTAALQDDLFLYVFLLCKITLF